MKEIDVTPHVVIPINSNRKRELQYFRCPVCDRWTWVTQHEKWCTGCGARVDVQQVEEN